jgi:hypothetical protein
MRSWSMIDEGARKRTSVRRRSANAQPPEKAGRVETEKPAVASPTATPTLERQSH